MAQFGNLQVELGTLDPTIFQDDFWPPTLAPVNSTNTTIALPLLSPLSQASSSSPAQLGRNYRSYQVPTPAPINKAVPSRYQIGLIRLAVQLYIIETVNCKETRNLRKAYYKNINQLWNSEICVVHCPKSQSKKPISSLRNTTSIASSSQSSALLATFNSTS